MLLSLIFGETLATGGEGAGVMLGVLSVLTEGRAAAPLEEELAGGAEVAAAGGLGRGSVTL